MRNEPNHKKFKNANPSGPILFRGYLTWPGNYVVPSQIGEKFPRQRDSMFHATGQGADELEYHNLR